MQLVAERIEISIKRDFTAAPGARKINDGLCSGEEFLNKWLKPKFEEALRERTVLHIDLDDTEGYATSFLEEAFGGLARLFDPKLVLKTLDFKSNDEPLLIEEIQMYIEDARG